MLALTVFLLTVCGCHAKYPIDVTIPDANLCPPVVDILLPLGEGRMDDVSYEACCALDMDEDSIRNTELCNYQTDGYRSMLVHYGLSDYRIEEQEDGSCQVEFFLNGKREFEDLCQCYSTFKIAAADEKGNILYVSESYPIELHENVYLEEITFDVGVEKVTPHYHYDRPFWLELLEALTELCIPVMPVCATAFLIFTVIMRFKMGKTYPNLWFTIPFAVCILPLGCYFGCRLDYALKTDCALESIWTDFTTLGSPWLIVYDLIPAFLLVIVFGWAAYLTNQAHTVTSEDT